MRYVLKLKSDGTFYRGREAGWGDKQWSTDINKAFLFQTEASARGAHYWSKTTTCNCLKRGNPWGYSRVRHKVKSCPIVAECNTKFNEKYEILKVRLEVVNV